MNQRFLCVVKNCRIGDGIPPRGRLVFMYFHSKMKLQINNFATAKRHIFASRHFFPTKMTKFYGNSNRSDTQISWILRQNAAMLQFPYWIPPLWVVPWRTQDSPPLQKHVVFLFRASTWLKKRRSRRAGHEARKAPPSSRFVWWSTYPWVQRWAPRNCLCLMRISKNIKKKLYIKMCIAGLHCSCIWRKKELRIWKSNITSVVWFAPGTRNNHV